MRLFENFNLSDDMDRMCGLFIFKGEMPNITQLQEQSANKMITIRIIIDTFFILCFFSAWSVFFIFCFVTRRATCM